MNGQKTIAKFIVNRRKYELTEHTQKDKVFYSVSWLERGKPKHAGFKINEKGRFERIPNMDPLAPKTEEQVFEALYYYLVIGQDEKTKKYNAFPVLYPEFTYDDITEGFLTEHLNEKENEKEYRNYGITEIVRSHDYIIVLGKDESNIYKYDANEAVKYGFALVNDFEYEFRHFESGVIGILFSMEKFKEIGLEHADKFMLLGDMDEDEEEF